jgi:predicted amidohydrolase
MRKVRVASVTAPALEAREDQTTEEIINDAINFWKSEIAKVLPDAPDLIVLPELCDRPKVGSISERKQSEIATSKDRRFLNFLAETALENRLYIAYPTYRMDDSGLLWNSCIILDRKGEVVGCYDKNHLVTFENVDRKIEYGRDIAVIDLDFGRVGIAICFDLNFTELLDKYRRLGIEILIFPSEYHGGLMQGYWAYQLRTHLLSSIRPPAPSTLISPLGELIATSTNYFNHFTEVVNLDYIVIHLDGHFEKLTKIKNKYGSRMQIYDPGLLGAVLIVSECETVSAMDLVTEFSLTLLDDYLDASRRHRNETETE